MRSVRIGRYMEIDVQGQNGELESRLHRLCRDLLSNPVIEDYELQKGESGKQEERKAESGSHKKTLNAQRSTSNIQQQKTKRKRKSLR